MKNPDLSFIAKATALKACLPARDGSHWIEPDSARQQQKASDERTFLNIIELYC
jgi:hypothetical protein